MATAFQKGNRHQVAESVKAFIYVPNGVSAITNINSITPTTIQQVVPWQFKGTGQIEVSSPPGFNLPNGVAFGQPTLVANSSGGYASGNHPIVQFSIIAGTSNVNVSASDIFIVQY